MRPEIARAVFVDFESLVEGDLTLAKMSTRQYLADPRFRVLCVTIAVGPGNIGFYFSGAEEQKDRLDAARERLASLADSGFTLVSHNIGFDGLLALLHWGIRFSHYFDTLGYARFLGLQPALENAAPFFGYQKAEHPPFTEGSLRDPSRRGEMAIYCATDTALSRELFAHALAYDGFPDVEFRVIDATARTNLRGLHVDCEAAVAVGRRLSELRTTTLANLAAEFRFDTSALNKIERVREFVFDRWQLALPSLNKKHPDFVASMVSHPEAGRFLGLRARANALSTAIKRLHARAQIGGVIYNFLHYYGGHTGRFSAGGRDSENLNVHSMFKRDNGASVAELADERTIVIPRPGCWFRAADLSNIEARVVAWLAGESVLLEKFATGEDVYVWFVQQIFPGVTIVKGGENRHLRDLGKESVLGLGFGMGFALFLNRVRAKLPGIDAELVKKIFDAYQNMFQNIRRLRYALFRRFGDAADRRLQSIDGRIHMHASVEPTATAPTVIVALPTGRWLHYRSIRSELELGPYGPRPTYWYAAEASTTARPVSGTRRRQRHVIGAKMFPDGQIRAPLKPQTLVENVVQAIARDVMVHQALALEELGLPTAFHTHDEVVVECGACECAAELHQPTCAWIQAGGIMAKIMSSVPHTLPALAGVPLACELNQHVGQTYG